MAHNTGPTGRGSSRWIWYIVGAVIILLLLAWLAGLFGADEAVQVDGEAAVVEEPAATGEAAEEAAEEAAD